MPKKGLTRDIVIDAALCLVEEKGPAAFSMRELAGALEVKAASLYNHIESMDQLVTDVGLRAVEQMVDLQLSAIEGKTREEALFALADAYRTFATEHIQLYKIIMGLQKNRNPVLAQAGEQILHPILQVLESYGLEEAARMHWQRILRSMMHGFCVHENIGGFTRSPLSTDDSYHMAIRCLADSLSNFH